VCVIQTNKHLRCDSHAGLLGGNDQTHHRMEPNQMAPKPLQKQKSYQQQSLRRPQPTQHQSYYGPDHQKSLTQSQTDLDKHYQQEGRHLGYAPHWCHWTGDKTNRHITHGHHHGYHHLAFCRHIVQELLTLPYQDQNGPYPRAKTNKPIPMPPHASFYIACNTQNTVLFG
jgi:hypothetical protein